MGRVGECGGKRGWGGGRRWGVNGAMEGGKEEVTCDPPPPPHPFSAGDHAGVRRDHREVL